MRNRYSWMLLVLALSVSVFFVGKHYYTKAYAQKAIDVFVMKQGVPSSDEPNVKYTPEKTEDDFNLYHGEAYEDGGTSLYVYRLKLYTGRGPELSMGKLVLHNSNNIFDANGEPIEATEIKKGDKLSIYLDEKVAVIETYPGQIDDKYIFKIVRE